MIIFSECINPNGGGETGKMSLTKKKRKIIETFKICKGRDQMQLSLLHFPYN